MTTRTERAALALHPAEVDSAVWMLCRELWEHATEEQRAHVTGRVEMSAIAGLALNAADVFQAEVNRLRAKAGLPERFPQAVFDLMPHDCERRPR